MTTLLKTKSNNNLLGLDKPPSETKVVVAMSGGVDSSVVAGLMKMSGYQVIGMTLQLYDYAQINKKPGTCCAGQDIYDAKRVSEKLEIVSCNISSTNRSPLVTGVLSFFIVILRFLPESLILFLPAS